jgi:lipoprotein-releasing system ATP-binding protein
MNRPAFLADAAAAPALLIRGLTRCFVQGAETIHVLRRIDLAVARGEIVALLGPSGAGKSTLLQAAGLLEGGHGGSIAIAGIACAGLDDRGRTAMRRERLGFVYQFHHLLPDFSALENVMLPQLVAGKAPAEARARARALLEGLGLGQRLSHTPSQLSGGEQQRVAVARALANRPVLVLADEPTGNLDEATAERVLAAFLALVRGEGAAALVATHNRALAARMDRVVRLHDGFLDEVRLDDGRPGAGGLGRASRTADRQPE